jgi:hypothetical protein
VSEQTEEEYLIERLSKLLAEISVIVNGPQPMGVLWSYADLPQKVQALKDAAALNAQAGVVEALRELTDAQPTPMLMVAAGMSDKTVMRLCKAADKARAALAAIKGEKP